MISDGLGRRDDLAFDLWRARRSKCSLRRTLDLAHRLVGLGDGALRWLDPLDDQVPGPGEDAGEQQECAANDQEGEPCREARCYETEGRSEIENDGRRDPEVSSGSEQPSAGAAQLRRGHELGLGQLDLVLHQQLHVVGDVLDDVPDCKISHVRSSRQP